MNMIKYPQYAKELMQALETDQAIWKTFWAQNYATQDTPEFKRKFNRVRKSQNERATRVLEILDAITLPSISNVGCEAAQAMSIIALHDSLGVLQRILDAFLNSYALNKQDTYYQAIPAMTDRVLILEHRPQRFGTQWEGNGLSVPYLPTVENFEHVNERRAEYGIEPLRWPKSLAIPESEQPWLETPLSELIMRDITDEEFEQRYQEYVK